MRDSVRWLHEIDSPRAGAVTVAALYVQKGGVYYGLPHVDPWDEERDARRYAGPAPVVAHPPCARWCRYASAAEAVWGKKKGEDGGCFAAALAAVRKWGGVLEHPAYSAAWRAFGLPWPPSIGGWARDLHGGWCCQVDQAHYGHRASKGTWLYFVSLAGTEPPPLVWGPGSGDPGVTVDSLHSKERSRTPLPFRDVLLDVARSTRRREAV